MEFTKEYHCIPDSCRDQHLAMAPSYASPFRDRGIRGVGLHEVAPPYEVRRLSFPWHLALITVSGKAEFNCLGRAGVMGAGQIWVGPMDTAYQYKALDDWIFISAALYRTHDFMHLEEGIFHRDLSQSTRPVVHAIEAYLYESASTLGPGATAPKGLAHYISEAIVRELKTEEFGTRNRMRMRLTQVWEEVNANPGADWKLPVLAKRMHVSVRQFQRIMKENYDLTAEGLLMRIRMEHARELLSSTDMTMMMVADRIGYQCVFAFSKGFKRHFGTPPGAYRKAANERVITQENS